METQGLKGEEAVRQTDYDDHGGGLFPAPWSSRCSRHLSFDPVNCADAAAKYLRRFENPRAGRQLLLDALDNGIGDGSTSEPFSFRPGTGQPGLDPFFDDVRLELGEDGDHPEHRLASRRRGIERLLVQE